MSEDLKAVIAVVPGIVLFVYLYIMLFAKWKTRKEKFIEKAKAKGHVTEGRRAKYRYASMDNKQGKFSHYIIWVKYEYVVNGKTYYKKLRFKRHRFSFPDHVNVYYDARNPRKAVCPHEARRGRSGYLIPLIATGLVIRTLSELLDSFFWKTRGSLHEHT